MPFSVKERYANNQTDSWAPMIMRKFVTLAVATILTSILSLQGYSQSGRETTLGVPLAMDAGSSSGEKTTTPPPPLSTSLPANPSRIPAYPALHQAALSRSLESKQSALTGLQASVNRSLIEDERLPRIGLGAAWTARRPEREPAGSGAQSYGVTAQYNVYDFGRLDARLEQAKAVEDIALLGRQEINEALSWRLAWAYLDLLASIHLRDVSRTNFTASQARLESVRKDYRMGLRSERDFVAAQADLGSFKLSIQAAESSVRRAVKALALITGLQLGMDGSGAEPGLDGAPELLARTPAAWRSLISRWDGMRLSRSQIRRAAEKSALATEEKLIEASNRPTLDLQLRAEEAGNWGEKLEELYTGQIQLNWDLPWTGRARDQHQLISLRRQSIEFDEAIELKQRSDAEQAGLQDFELALERWQAVGDQETLREKQHRLVREGYAGGTASAFEVSTSELDLGNMRMEKIRTLNSLIAAVLVIAEARRIDDPAEVFQ